MTTRPSAIRTSISALSLACLAFAALAAFPGCQGPPEDDTSDSESTEESLIRPPGGRACGNKVCAPGLVCCNASCGTCTRPGGFCTLQYCGPTPDEGVSAGPCDTDADCRAVANYCETCACLALSATDKDPVCKGSRVSCLVNPCLRRQAYCDQGTCRLGPIGSIPPPVR
jgi:hypothetical protein